VNYFIDDYASVELPKIVTPFQQHNNVMSRF